MDWQHLLVEHLVQLEIGRPLLLVLEGVRGQLGPLCREQIERPVAVQM